MAVRIPWMPKSGMAQPLVRCLKFTAKNMGVSEHFAAVMMTYFLERLAAEVAQGEVVRLPGFGIFGPYLYTPKMKGKEPFCMPSFTAAVGFRQEVKTVCPTSRGANKALLHYRHSNHPSSGAKKHTSRVFTAMKDFRKHVRSQAKKLGVKAGPSEILP